MIRPFRYQSFFRWQALKRLFTIAVGRTTLQTRVMKRDKKNNQKVLQVHRRLSKESLLWFNMIILLKSRVDL